MKFKLVVAERIDANSIAVEVSRSRCVASRVKYSLEIAGFDDVKYLFEKSREFDRLLTISHPVQLS